MSKRDYYRKYWAYGQGASQDEDQKAYRRWLYGTIPTATPEIRRLKKNSKEAAEAYEVLSDSDKRTVRPFWPPGIWSGAAAAVADTAVAA